MMEEFFNCYVEGFEGKDLRLRTVSSGGEEAWAWLPLKHVRVQDRSRIRIGTALRIEIHKQNGQRSWRIQVV